MSPDLPIGEIDVQVALAASLNQLANLRDEFLLAVNLGPYRDCNEGIFHTAVRSVREIDGESDLVVDWHHNLHGRARVLIEVKLAANFRDRQGERYRERSMRAVLRGDYQAVVTVLVAPRDYLAVANPESRHFDFALPLESFVNWDNARSNNLRVVRDALDRLASGRPLGAKGLFQTLHFALASECARRKNGIVIRNNATDWVSLRYAECPTGMRLNYRIRQGVAEIRILKSYRGDRTLLEGANDARVSTVKSGGELFLKYQTLAVSNAARNGTPLDDDIVAIVDAFEYLREWWTRHVSDTTSND
jgi:hypothetical protein